MYVFWEYRNVAIFQTHVCFTLSKILNVDVPCAPNISLGDDISTLALTYSQRHIILAALIAIKKDVVPLLATTTCPYSLTVDSYLP